MDHDYEQRMANYWAAVQRSALRSDASRTQVRHRQGWAVPGITFRHEKKRLRGMKRRQRLMVRGLLRARLMRMAAKGIEIPEGVVIP